MTSVAATTVVGLPSAPISSSPTATSPIVVQPVGVGRGVSSASALPTAGLAAGVELQHGAEDGAVGRAVEVLLVEELERLGDGVLGQQHRAEDALLGLDVVRRDALVRRRGVAWRTAFG